MPFVSYSVHTKLGVLRMTALYRLPLNTVKCYLGITTPLAERTLLRWQQIFSETRTILPNPANYQPRGRKQRISGDGDAFIEGSLLDDSTLYREELQLKLFHHTGVWVSLSTIQVILNQRLGLTCKKAQRIHLNRSSRAQAEFSYHIAQYPAHYLVFADESCVSQQACERINGWLQAGQRAVQVTSKINGKNYSCLPFVSLDRVIECVVKVGSFKRKQFTWVLKHLVVCFLTFQY